MMDNLVEPPQLRFDFVTRVSDIELRALRSWLLENTGSHPTIGLFMLDVIAAEFERRASNGAIEAGSFSLPTWTCSQLANALQSCYIIQRFALTPKLSEVFDELFQHLLCNAVAVLDLCGDLQA